MLKGMKGLYKAFSSWEYQRSKTFSVSDVEAVKLDLLNHIFTLKGTRVMMPDFGTRIKSIVFDPMDQISLDIIEEDLRVVFKFDPRVKLLNLRVTPDEVANTVTATAKLLYVELDIVDNLDIHITFENG